MRIAFLWLIGISISLATAVTKTDETTTELKGTDVKKTTTAKETAAAATKPAANTQTKLKSTRQSKVLKTTAGAPGENRGKRTLYDFENPGYLYPEIASRRAGYNTDAHASNYYPQAGFYNGQNAIAQYPSDFGGHYAHYPQYLEAPEPIIEIIIKDSNETLPTLASTQPIVTKKKKEKVHVFYVNYKKDENNKLHLESPIASLNNDDEPQSTDHDEEEEILHYPQVVTPLPPLKSTTLRTIIHPDSEKYHSNSGIHVSFGSEDKSQTGHILEEHDAESIQRQVVALPIDDGTAPKSLVESYYANTRSDYAQGRSPPAVGNSLYTAPFHQPPQHNNYYEVQQQQLPAQQTSNYFRPPTPPTPAAATQHQYNFYQKQQQQQQRPAFTGVPAQQPQAQPLYRKPPTSAPTTQQQLHQHLQQQSHYYVNHNQQYQQHQPQQQQPSFTSNQFYHHHQQTNSHKPSKPTFFPTPSPKQQELPSRQAPPPYQPIKFRPTPMPAPQIKPVPVPIPAKLENTHYQPAQRYPQEQQQQQQHKQQQQNYYQQQQQQNKQQHFSFNRQQQQFAQSTPDFALPSSGSQQSSFYKPQTQPQPQQQQHQLAIASQNSVSQTKFQSQPSPQPHVNSAQSVLGSLQNYFNVQPSKETELLKSIPKFEQHITETIHHQPSQQQDINYNQYSYTQRNEVIHDIPAPNLGPTLRPNVQQIQQPLAASSATGGHYVTQQQSHAQPQFTNFVTTSQSIADNAQQQYPSSTAEPPHYAQSTDGQKIMIVTPVPPTNNNNNNNNFQQYHSSHYQNQQSTGLQPQIIYNSQPLQTQATNNFVQQPRNPATSALHSTLKTAPNSQFSVSTYHSDVFKELEQRKQFFQAHQLQQQQNEPSPGAYIPSSTPTPSTAPTTTAKPTPVASPTSAKSSQTLLQLPDEVPDDLRQQLLSSGILNNADISVLDYDKVGDVALENLPAEHLQHFYGAGGGAQIGESNKVVTVVKPNGDSVALSEKDIERVKQSNTLPQRQQLDVKVVRFGAHNEKSVTDKYLKTDATVVPPVDLSDRQYNRYLPLKINGAQFPLPDSEELRGKKVVSVVVLAPVEAQQLQPTAQSSNGGSDKRSERDASDAKEVKFLGGDLIKTLVKKPTKENFKRWLEKEARTDVEMQSVVLLVAKSSEDAEQEIFMYDIVSGTVNKLNGELSSAFVNVAEENACSEDLEHASTLDPNILETMMHKNRR